MAHRRNLHSLSSVERAQLADLMGEFLHDSVIGEHVQVFNDNNHFTFFPNHRTYIAKLEAFLMANGGEKFVPLPFWNDNDDIPSSFLRVEPRDNGVLRPEMNSHWAQTRRHFRLPDSARPPKVCEDRFDLIEPLVQEFETWHIEVHTLLGPVMALGAVYDSPAAFIFWPWHAFNDEIYHEWERCRLRPVRSLCAGRNADGRLEAFVLGKDGRPWHCWHEPAGTYAEWSLWHRLGELGDGELQQLLVGANADGRLEVFAIASDRTLRHKWQETPNGTWSDWGSLDGSLQRIALGTNSDGRLEVFGIDSSGTVLHTWQTAPNNGWSNWESLGLATTRIKDIAIGNHKGRLEIFAIGEGNELFSRRQAAPNLGPWSAWQNISGGKKLARVAVAKHGDGHVQIFAVSTDDKVLYKWRRPTSGQWSGAWRELAGLQGSIPTIAVARDADGALELFAIGSDGKLWRNRELLPGASVSWSGWAHFIPLTSGQAFAIGVEQFTVATRSDGSLEIFAAIRNDVVWHTGQIPTAFVDWQRWQLL